MLKNRRQPDAAPKDLDKALRARRKELNLTMQSVADATGLSVGFISQVERGITTPSLGSLVSLAEALQADISDFLQQPPSAGQSTHTASRHAYSVPGADVSYERLSTIFPDSQLHSVIVHEPPGHRAEPISHRGEEMFYVISGEITVEIEGAVEILSQGDSIHFNSRRVHSTWNHTTSSASILWCGTMDVFGDAPPPIHKENANIKALNKPTGKTIS